MSLHDTVEGAKKIGLYGGISLGCLVVLFILVKVLIFIYGIVFPPKVQPPTITYGKIPVISFPKNTVNTAFTYTLNTTSGTLPDLPDRVAVFPLPHNSPNLLNLDTVKKKVTTLGFVDSSGNTVQEVPLGGAYYEWNDPTGVNRKITFNIVNFDFIMNSNYLSALSVIAGQNITNSSDAISTATDFLDSISLTPPDLDLDKTKTPPPGINYVTGPKWFSVKNGILVPATALSNTQVIRVDLYQKDISYNLDTGRAGATGNITQQMQIPIVYPNPPYSTMSFWIASGENEADVMQADFTHQTIDQKDTTATYPILTPQQALDDLKNGKGYIASYYGTDSHILINNVYLAYYLGKTIQDYLMPVIVFEGQNGFMAYVSAIDPSVLQ